ncbi:MAG: hypothetical protein IPP41_11585 [Rhodocyclaceae bacterium]|nr:hypothetical protein [Rhodocyclaceae bacterium]
MLFAEVTGTAACAVLVSVGCDAGLTFVAAWTNEKESNKGNTSHIFMVAKFSSVAAFHRLLIMALTVHFDTMDFHSLLAHNGPQHKKSP